MIKRKNNSIPFLSLIGLILIFASFCIFIVNKYMDDKHEQIETEQIESFLETEPIEENEEQLEVKKESEVSIAYDYIAILEIPSINLKKGLVDYNSKYNNVKYNIQIIEHSDMPNIEKSNLILAGHNGTSNVSFFSNLIKMPENADIFIYYNGYKYKYKLSTSYEVEKDGEIEIIRDRSQNAITLITCKKNSKNKQIVFVGYLIDKVEY